MSHAKAVPVRFESAGFTISKMRESFCIDSPLWRLATPKAYSCDLRERAIKSVATGAPRREAAERFEVRVSSAVKWFQRWRDE